MFKGVTYLGIGVAYILIRADGGSVIMKVDVLAPSTPADPVTLSIYLKFIDALDMSVLLLTTA